MKRLVLSLILVSALGCASLPVSQIPQRIPDVIQTFDGDVSKAVDLSLDYLELAVTKEEQAANAYLLIRPLLPVTLQTQITHGFTTVSDLIIKAVEALKTGVKTWAEFRALLQPIVTAMNGLNDWIRQASPTPQSHWKALASDLTLTLAKAALQKVGK